MVTAATSATQNVITAVNKAGVHVDDTVSNRWPRRTRCCVTDEREMGCAWRTSAQGHGADCFLQGAVAFTGVIPVGGDHFTSDLSVGMSLPWLKPRRSEGVWQCDVTADSGRE